jgi:hypothetical protein
VNQWFGIQLVVIPPESGWVVYLCHNRDLYKPGQKIIYISAELSRPYWVFAILRDNHGEFLDTLNTTDTKALDTREAGEQK